MLNLQNKKRVRQRRDQHLSPSIATLKVASSNCHPPGGITVVQRKPQDEPCTTRPKLRNFLRKNFLEIFPPNLFEKSIAADSNFAVRARQNSPF
jgi:hypothetical protein